MNRPQVLGIPVDPITFEDMLQKIGVWIAVSDGLHQICTVNPEFIVVAQQNRQFAQVLHQADLCVPDGWGVVWALRLRGITVPQRVTGSDGVPLIAERAAKAGWTIFLLGGWNGVAAKAAHILCEKYPNLRIVGTYEGSPSPEEADVIIHRINTATPDILLVAYGAPKQDIWIDTYRHRLTVKVAMGIGGTLDFITGNVPRAPLVFRRLGLEWLYRLYLQPSRWRRMLRLPIFVYQVLRFGARSSHGTHH